MPSRGPANPRRRCQRQFAAGWGPAPVKEEDAVTIKPGWTGRFYEDFEVGDVYPIPWAGPSSRRTTSGSRCSRRTRTRSISTARTPRQTEFKRPLVDSTFTLALVTGQSVSDISQNAMANLGWDEVRLPNPVFEGDTIYSRSEVLDKRESVSRPNVGIVGFKTTGFNEHGTVVIEFKRTIMVYKREHAPATRGPVRRHRSDRVGPTGHQDARPRRGRCRWRADRAHGSLAVPRTAPTPIGLLLIGSQPCVPKAST